MTIRLNVLGFDLATITIDLDDAPSGAVVVGRYTATERGIDRLSHWWVDRMLKR